jgi:hypothetical protein
MASCVAPGSSRRLQPVDQTEDCLAGVVGRRHAQGFQVIRLKLESHEKGSSTLPLPHTTHSGRRQSLLTRLHLHHGKIVP